MWTYQQSTGKLWHDGTLIGVGYSGFGEGKNNPALQALPNIGPITRGLWTIGPLEHLDKPGPHGVCTMRLDPMPGTVVYGRSLFLMHGDALEHPGAASHGCIVQALIVRCHVGASDDRALQVVA